MSINIDEYLKKNLKININFDIVRGEINDKYIVYYLSSLANINLIQQIFQNFKQNNQNSYYGSIEKVDDFKQIITEILSGKLFVIHKYSINDFFFIETREYPSRSINEPETEQTIRGSKDGFNESIITNIGLIRRRIRSKNLTFEKYQVSKYSKCDIVVTYMDDRVDCKILENIKDRLIKNLDKTESLVMSDRALEELLFNQKYNVYPLVKYSERPDIVAIQLLKGKITLIVDNSSSVMIVPTNVFEHIKHIEEYRQNPLTGSFLRIIRLIAIIFSMFLIPLWLCVIKNPDDISIFLIPDNPNFIKIFYQVLVVEIMIEILRIATIHTPSKLSSTMGLVAALILGQFAVEIGVFSQEILLYCSLSAIGGFATPSYELSLSNKISKVFMIIMVGLFGKIGFLLSLFMLFIYLVRINLYNCPYLYPFVPFDLKEFKEIFFRIGKNINNRVR